MPEWYGRVTMPVYGYQLMSVRCLVTGKYAELKRQDGMSEEPNLSTSRARKTGSDG